MDVEYTLPLIRQAQINPKQGYKPKSEILRYLELEENMELFQRKRDKECNNTSYCERTRIFELLIKK